ncbi:hypothetical protein LTR78_001512 [Recurvomyces mirabilis]|uniref:Methyltransferase domain-containing protein n=1 Tax=Recurvomyces mirabilis TaxID=574656 RepID=A0AAE0WWC9_9PEZI|nr:hypothetical protein LTR78_001512 [Recurvomyces mirabilis]KAK5161491.1 hypothetical protein LTS14_001287 [Recurvomyces mirabilis]
MASNDYEAINKANWDERAPEHAKAPSYSVDRFIKDPKYLSDVVKFDIPLLPDINGLDIVHLQCHIGTDTISLARRGARSVVGLDFSSASLEVARSLAASAAGGDRVKYVEGSVYDAVEACGAGAFDMVFTGIGALCWIPSIKRWAEVVSKLLKPGGRLFIREGHPMLWAIDEKVEDHISVRYPYFETQTGEVFDEDTTYVKLADDSKVKESGFKSTKTVNWNHGLGETVTALMSAGLRLETFVEHKSVPWEALPGKMRERDDGEFELWEGQMNCPLTYTLVAVKSC